MSRADQKKLEDIADGFMATFPAFFRRVSRGVAHPSARKFDPSRFVLKAVHMHGPVRMSVIGSHMGISRPYMTRSEEHTSELQSRLHLVCRLLLEKKKK